VLSKDETLPDSEHRLLLEELAVDGSTSLDAFVILPLCFPLTIVNSSLIKAEA